MKKTLIIVLIIFSVGIGAFFHERDIVSSCKDNGKAGYSSWTGEILCEEMNGLD